MQQARWTADLRNHLFQTADLDHARRVLEVGCGSGALTGELSPRTGLQMHGLDIDAAALHFAAGQDRLTRFIQGDAFCLPFASDSFDIVFCHFLLLWLPDPAAALAEMLRSVRRGGWVLACAEPDYGGRIDYPPELAEVGRLQAEALSQRGADPQIGRKLLGLFSQLEMENVGAGVLGGQWQKNELGDDWQLEWETLRDDLGERLTAEQARQLFRVERRARAAEERVLFVPTFYAWGRKP